MALHVGGDISMRVSRGSYVLHAFVNVLNDAKRKLHISRLDNISQDSLVLIYIRVPKETQAFRVIYNTDDERVVLKAF
jgi:hypothetical protein